MTNTFDTFVFFNSGFLDFLGSGTFQTVFVQPKKNRVATAVKTIPIGAVEGIIENGRAQPRTVW